MHPLRNGSQATERPATKPLFGAAGWFTESGEDNRPSYPGADWFNHVIAEFQNSLAVFGVSFDPQNDDHLAKAFEHVQSAISPHSGIKFLLKVPGIKQTTLSLHTGLGEDGADYVWLPDADQSQHLQRGPNGGFYLAGGAVDAYNGTKEDESTLLSWNGTGFGCYLQVSNINQFEYDVETEATHPIVESSYTAAPGKIDSKNKDGLFAELAAGTSPEPSTGYVNAVDLTMRYTFVINETGHNQATSNNDGRTGIYANRVKMVHDGQGDLVAYNASIRVRSQKAGATHWLANPAGVLINGTLIGEADGVYLNPREIYLTDKPNEGDIYNVTCVGDVLNMDRNHITESKANGGIGQVWAAYRAQSVGAEAVDNILSGTGKFFAGIDFSMTALDFGTNKAAIALKADDRVYFNAAANAVDDPTVFIRANWRATEGFDDYSYYNSALSRWIVVVGGQETLQVSEDLVTVKGLIATDNIVTALGKSYFIGDKKIIGGRVTQWTRMTGAENKSTPFDTSTVTLQQLAQRVKALESAMHLSGGPNGLLSE